MFYSSGIVDTKNLLAFTAVFESAKGLGIAPDPIPNLELLLNRSPELDSTFDFKLFYVSINLKKNRVIVTESNLFNNFL